MSFGYIDLPEGILLGQGWMYDLLHPLMQQAHDTILLYGGTWLLMGARSTWYYWLILMGLFYVGIRICLNLIAAFKGAGDRLGDGIVEIEIPGDEPPVFVGGVQVFGETAERLRDAEEGLFSSSEEAYRSKPPSYWAS